MYILYLTHNKKFYGGRSKFRWCGSDRYGPKLNSTDRTNKFYAAVWKVEHVDLKVVTFPLLPSVMQLLSARNA